MRFKQYINEGWNEGTRSKSVSKEWALEWVRKNARKALKGTPIWRDSYTFKGDYRYTDPKKSPGRVSANTSNIYTILFNEILPSWKGWPKREVICSTDDISDNYRTYKVFFKDNAKIGVCPSTDIWDSFDIGLLSNQFNVKFENLYKELVNKGLDITEKGLRKALKEIDDKLEQQDRNVIFGNMTSATGEKMIDFLDRTFNPKSNGFRQVKVGSMITSDREVWSDKNCVLVNVKVIDEFLNAI